MLWYCLWKQYARELFHLMLMDITGRVSIWVCKNLSEIGLPQFRVFNESKQPSCHGTSVSASGVRNVRQQLGLPSSFGCYWGWGGWRWSYEVSDWHWRSSTGKVFHVCFHQVAQSRIIMIFSWILLLDLIDGQVTQPDIFLNVQDGLGDTIRVSLTEAPEEEIDPCTKLANLGMKISAEQKGVVSIDLCHYQQYVYISTIYLCFLFHIQECGHCLWWLGATALFLPSIGMSLSSYFGHCNLSIWHGFLWPV